MVLLNVLLTGALVSVIAFLVSLYIYFTWNFDYWKKRGVAGPRPIPFLGNYPKSTTNQGDTNFLTEAHEIFKYVKSTRFEIVLIDRYREQSISLYYEITMADFIIQYCV